MSVSEMRQNHKTVAVQVGSCRAEIDEEIAPLIREMWIAGIETYMSCQQDGWGLVWIQFPEAAGLVDFLNIVTKYERGANTLYNRMVHEWTNNTSTSEWIYEVFPDDLAFNRDAPQGERAIQDEHDGQPYFHLDFCVRFPQCDLPIVLRRMKQYNARPATREA